MHVYTPPWIAWTKPISVDYLLVPSPLALSAIVFLLGCVAVKFSYQVGVTPEGTERPRAHCERVSKLPDGHRPLTLCPPEADPKWRFFWTVVGQWAHTSKAGRALLERVLLMVSPAK